MEEALHAVNAAIAADRAGRVDEAIALYEQGSRVIRDGVLPGSDATTARSARQALTQYQHRIAELLLVKKRMLRDEERRLALRYESLRRGHVGTGSAVEPVSDAALRGDTAATDRECREIEERFRRLRAEEAPMPSHADLETRLAAMRGPESNPPSAAAASGGAAPSSAPPRGSAWDGTDEEDPDVLVDRLVAIAMDEQRLGIQDAPGAVAGPRERKHRRKYKKKRRHGRGSKAPAAPAAQRLWPASRHRGSSAASGSSSASSTSASSFSSDSGSSGSSSSTAT